MISLHELEARNAMDVLSGAIAALWHAAELVLIYVETHHWIFAFLAGGCIFTFTARPCTPDSMRSRSGSTKSESGLPLSSEN
jgi:hypothetical protein